jgi:transcriptional regulator with XRE-family HTH domain
MPAEIFARRLREHRQAAGLSQRDIADEMRAEGFEWHQTTAQRVETAKRSIHLNEAVALAAILGVDLAVLLRPENDDKRALLDEFDDLTEQYNTLYDQYKYAELQVHAANANIANAIKERDEREAVLLEIGAELQRLDRVRRNVAEVMSDGKGDDPSLELAAVERLEDRYRAFSEDARFKWDRHLIAVRELYDSGMSVEVIAEKLGDVPQVIQEMIEESEKLKGRNTKKKLGFLIPTVRNEDEVH